MKPNVILPRQLLPVYARSLVVHILPKRWFNACNVR